MLKDSFFKYSLLPLLASVASLLGCSNVGQNAGATQGTSAQSTVVQKKFTPIKRSDRTLILWNGEDTNAGGKWASVTNQNIDTASIEVERNQGNSGTTSLKFQAAGSDWMGFGWNWLDLWGTNDGQDISEYKILSFYIKAEGAKPPPAHSIGVQLASGNQPEGRSLAMQILDYVEADFMNGEWHLVEVPLADFEGTNIPEKGPMDLKYAREFSIGVNTPQYVDFDLYIDDITLSK